MVNKPLTMKLLRDLWTRKGTLFALVMILAAGVASYTGMAAVYQDLDSARAKYYSKYHLADFMLDLKRAPETVVYKLERLPNILRLRKRIKINAVITLPKKSYSEIIKPIPSIIISLPVPKQNIINNVRMISGMWFSNPHANEVLVNQRFMHARNLKIGDRIKVRFPDEERTLLIVGIVTSPEYTFVLAPNTLAPDPGGFAIIYSPFKYLQQYSELNGSFNQLLGMTKNNSDIAIENTMSLLADKLDPYGVLLQTSQREQISAKILHDELANIKKSNSFLPTIFLLVAALILNIILGRLVTKQRNSIGILKAIGYNNFIILRHYMSFGLIIGLLGGIIGVIFGYGLQYLMLEQYKTYFLIPNLRTYFYLDIAIIGILVSIFGAIIGSIFSTYKAARLNPTESMQPPTPEIGKHIIMERIKTFWQSLSFQNKMIMRAIFRNRLRSFVTIAAAIAAAALVFSALEFLDSLYKMANFSFDEVQHQDYNLTLRDPLGKDIIRPNAILPGVKQIEGQLVVPVKLRFGPYKKNTKITGLPQNNILYTPVDTDKHKISISKSGVVINETLAKILNAKTGDKIMVRPLLGNRTTTYATITKIIKTYLGLACYADQTWLSRLLGNSYVTNHILFKLHKNADENEFIAAINQFAPMINLISTKVSKKLFFDSLYKFMIFTTIILIVFAGIIAMGAILNTAMISLNERERDVASLRMLGFTSMQAAQIFFGESILLNSIGILLGLGGGIYLAYYMSIVFSTEVYRMPMVIRPIRLIETVLIMFTFVLASQIIIYNVIRKLDWLEILNIKE